MNVSEFCDLLTEAVNGSSEALGKLLELYMPLINRNSYINGKLDEDLRQHIMLHIVMNISKFKI